MEIRRGFEEAERLELAGLIWDGFASKLGRLLRDRESAVAVLAPGLHPPAAVVAGPAGTPLGVMLLRDREAGRPLDGRLRDWVAAYGLPGGALRLIAFGLLDERPPPGVLVVDSLAVASHARGRGIGTTLLEEAETEAARRGCRELMLEVASGNPAARRLYERRGYRLARTVRSGIVVRNVLGLTAYHEMRKAPRDRG